MTQCVRAPWCLMSPSTQHDCLPTSSVVLAARPECRYYKHLFTHFCNRSIHSTSSGVLATLPAMSGSELADLYDNRYFSKFERTAVAKGNFNTAKADAMAALAYDWIAPRLLKQETRLRSVVEMGCMGGHLLTRFNSTTEKRHLRCFEASPAYYPMLRQRFEEVNKIQQASAGGRAELTTGIFNGKAVAPNSIDLFMSSHVVEHLADPCPWMADVWSALRENGVVYTQVPLQHEDPYQKVFRGVFHLLYFDEPSFIKMMVRQGFVLVASQASDDKGVLQNLFRKPSSEEYATIQRVRDRERGRERTDRSGRPHRAGSVTANVV